MNERLRAARLAKQSPLGPEFVFSRQELAEAVNSHIYRTTGQMGSLDQNYIGKLERGEYRWPRADYRAGFRAVLGAATDAELGFYIKRRLR
ncbi:hypothetical protein [Polymorphospora rubra]|uniref:hypothetical protein n=1 Tax=Polymorphospora rubra TaxID=338584 RepID=UPI0033DD7504